MVRLRPQAATLLALGSLVVLFTLILASALAIDAALDGPGGARDLRRVERSPAGERTTAWVSLEQQVLTHAGEQVIIPPLRPVVREEIEVWVVTTSGLTELVTTGSAPEETVLLTGNVSTELSFTVPDWVPEFDTQTTHGRAAVIYVVWLAPTEGARDPEAALLEWAVQEHSKPIVVRPHLLSLQPWLTAGEVIAALGVVTGLVLMTAMRVRQGSGTSSLERGLTVAEVAGDSLRKLRDLHWVLGGLLIVLAFPAIVGFERIGVPHGTWYLHELAYAVTPTTRFVLAYGALVLLWVVSVLQVLISHRRWQKGWAERPRLE